MEKRKEKMITIKCNEDFVDEFDEIREVVDIEMKRSAVIRKLMKEYISKHKKNEN